MSRSLYSVFEYVDTKTGEWQTANLYELSDDKSSYYLAQLITGGSEYLSALFGEEPFDYPLNDDGEIVDNLVDPLEQIEEIIKDATSGGVPRNVAFKTKEYYEKFVSNEFESISGTKHYPSCVTFNLRDLNMLEMLAKSVSPKALRFYNRYFAQIRWILHTIMRMEYVSGGSDVRVIIWGY